MIKTFLILTFILLTFPIQTFAVSKDILWSADFETGNLNQWYFPDTKSGNRNGGGEYNSGNGTIIVSPEVARSGKFSAKTVTISNGQDNATRLFRWQESQKYPSAYYSAWYYFPLVYTPQLYWNIFQFKSKKSDGSANDPFFTLNVGNRPNGQMFVYIYDHKGQKGIDKQITKKDLDIHRWIHIEAYLNQSSKKDGQLTIWQDGVKIYDLNKITTKYANGDNQWSINNYSNGVSPNPAIIYMDDAVISKSRVGVGKNH